MPLAPTLENWIEATVNDLDAEGQRPVQSLALQTSLAQQLVAERLERRGWLGLHLPPARHADAVAHGLLQAVGAAGERPDPALSLEEMVEQAAGPLAGRKLFFLLPLDWELPGAARQSRPEWAAFDRYMQERRRRFLAAWREASGPGGPRLLFLGLRGVPRPSRQGQGPAHLGEEPTLPALGILSCPELWGELLHDIEKLAETLGKLTEVPLPLQRLRLLLLLVLLEDSPRAAQRSWREGSRSPSQDLARRVLDSLRARASESGIGGELDAFLARLAALRLPLPRTAYEQRLLSPSLRDDERLGPLLRHGLVWGRERVIPDPLLQNTIRKELPGNPTAEAEERVHRELAATYEELDGQPSPARLMGLPLLAWLERAHHLALGGEASREDWEALHEGLLPDQLVERARSESLRAGRLLHAGERQRARHLFHRAAELYRRAVELDPKLHYAWHYLGYNLDRAGRDRAEAERAYREALALDPANPWYHARLCTFLVGRARFREAEEAWGNALEILDPDGSESFDNPWLAKHLHAWVALAWIEAGELERAREVLDLLGPEPRGEKRVQEVRQQLEELTEVWEAGFALRPPGFQKERDQPTVLPETDREGRPRRAAYAGSMELEEDGSVLLRYAELGVGDGPRRAFEERVSREELALLAGGRVDPASQRWFELGEYGRDGSELHRLLRTVPLAEGRRLVQDRDPLRWLEEAGEP